MGQEPHFVIDSDLAFYAQDNIGVHVEMASSSFLVHFSYWFSDNYAHNFILPHDVFIT